VNSLLTGFGSYVDDLRPAQPFNPTRCSNLGSCAKQNALKLEGADEQSKTTDQDSAKQWMFEIAHFQHEKLGQYFKEKGWLVKTEQAVDLPEPWTGRFDYLLKINHRYIVIDLKTMHPNGLHYLKGPKDHHVLQVGSYHIGLHEAYQPLDAAIIYADRGGQNLPVSFMVKPDHEAVRADMTRIEAALQIPSKELPLMPRVQKVDSKFDVKLIPDWRCEYCEFEGVSCGPNMSKNKVGEWIPGTGEFIPRMNKDETLYAPDFVFDKEAV